MANKISRFVGLVIVIYIAQTVLNDWGKTVWFAAGLLLMLQGTLYSDNQQ